MDPWLDGIRWALYPQVAAVPVARAFVLRLRQFSRRPKTIAAYARNLDHFLATFATAPAAQWIEADEGHLLAYLEELRTRPRARPGLPHQVVPLFGGQLADATIAQHVVALRQFYAYLIRTGTRRDPINPVPRGSIRQGLLPAPRGIVRVRTRLPWIAPAAVWERLVLHVVTQETPRNRAMILVAYDGALRREELVRLRTDDYDRAQALLKIRAETSKSGRDRWVPLSPIGQRVLDHYLDRPRQALVAAYGLDPLGTLFLSESTRNPGQPLLPGAFNDVVAAVRATLRLPQLHPHTFRHQRLTALKTAGVPLEEIALFAGHASTETTRLYLHLAPSELGAKLRAATARMDAYLEHLLEARVPAGVTDGR